MTDDQDVASLDEQEIVRERLVDEGVSFEHSFASLPLCCPSRATFLSGRYAHNHGLVLADPHPSRELYRDNAGRLEQSTLPLWLQAEGYRTALVGKYMNGYGDFDRRELPPGWDHWVSPVGERSIYGYEDFTLNEDGMLVDYSGSERYQTDVLTERAVQWIGEVATESPFFLFVSYVAPHIGSAESGYCTGSAQPAARHEGAAESIELPRPASFDEEDVGDKPGYIRDEPRLDESVVQTLSGAHRCRIESLLSVDEGVGAILDALEDAGELDDTVVIYTSDNGWLEGQHRLTHSKFFPYEESVSVPLVVRGAGGEPGSRVETPVVNVDLAPTILELAGAAADVALDGRSWLAALSGAELPPRDILFEGFYSNDSTNGETRRYYASVRDGALQYTEYHTGEVELYDLERDPLQLDNLAGTPEYGDREAALALRLEDLSRCEGNLQQEVAGKPPCS